LKYQVHTIQATGQYEVNTSNDPMTKLVPYLDQLEAAGWEVFSIFARYNDITVVSRKK
jgi:hypothetical protein